MTELLRNRLDKVPLPSEKVEACILELLADQQTAYKAKVVARSSVKTSVAGTPWSAAAESVLREPAGRHGSLLPQPAVGSETTFARRIALLAIEKMSLQEVRELRVPLGAIIDAGIAPR
jgi:hypothetical protein